MKKLNKEEYQNRLNELFPNEPVELLEYTKASAPCTYKCLICGEEYKIYKAGDLQRKKHLCNKCWYGKGQGTQTKIYKQKALEIISEDGDKEFVEFGYNNKLSKPTIKFLCTKCNSVSEFQLIYFLKRHQCPHCSYNAKHFTTEGIQYRLPKEYTLLEDYKGTDSKVLIRHEECGFIWKATIHDILSGCGCPKCSKKRSKGERKISKLLEDWNLNYEAEKKFEWSGLKRYDFFLNDYNIIIEYMGIQHYKEVPHFTRSLQEQQAIDILKRNLALSHNIKYIEISYLDFDKLDMVLAQRLSQLGVGLISETESILNKDEDIV